MKASSCFFWKRRTRVPWRLWNEGVERAPIVGAVFFTRETLGGIQRQAHAPLGERTRAQVSSTKKKGHNVEDSVVLCVEARFEQTCSGISTGSLENTSTLTLSYTLLHSLTPSYTLSHSLALSWSLSLVLPYSVTPLLPYSLTLLLSLFLSFCVYISLLHSAYLLAFT